MGGSVWILGKIYSPESGKALAQAALVESVFLEIFKNCKDVTLGDMVSGHGGDELASVWGILRTFSNLHVSIITLEQC